MVVNNDLEINNISDLQLALIENNNTAINGYIERLDRETSNVAIRQAGEHFGFPTIEVNGVFYAANQHIAAVFGYKKPNSFLELLKRRGIEGINMAGFTYDTCIKIKETLKLMDGDRKTTLHEWPAFLIGGMNSENEEAKAVQGYLLRMEKVARLGFAVSGDHAKSANTLISKAKTLVLLISVANKTTDTQYRNILNEQIEQFSGHKIKKSQKEFDFKDEHRRGEESFALTGNGVL